MSFQSSPEGNWFYFQVLKILNGLLVIFGLILITASICLYFALGALTYLDIAIFAIGVFISILCYSLFHMKSSYSALSCYITLVLSFFILTLLFIIFVSAVPEKAIGIIGKEIDNDEIKEKVMSHLQLVKRGLFGLAILLLVDLLMA
eukprot:TRINITY_DN9199_c0_g3_i5.p1 TRINITY_DN9199_c0_g3~~TRINITY_DN9199_c0_g3_i5.p1  ORF type:complete len:147 (-),score=33.50 TRINITY_DN9199_c0_g3_i5:76-516(-)